MVEEICDRPIECNGNLGYCTNYVNLLDLSAISVPAGQFEAGPGFGVTVRGEAGDDALVTGAGEHVRAASENRRSTPSHAQSAD